MNNLNAEMAEFASNLWKNYIKPKMAEELSNHVWFYRATVTANPGNGRLTVQQPYDDPITVRCTEPLESATAGEVVTVLCLGKDTANNQIAFMLGSDTGLEDYVEEHGGSGSDFDILDGNG